jgi:predicted phosphoadenosine phosphosulfate sulfurtransferase
MGKPVFQEQNVYDAGLDRTRMFYNRFDDVYVFFSGGKDSTSVLHLAKKIATELDKLHVKVVFIDEEVIHPPTVEYMHRINEDKDIDLRWYCLPFKHRNACSNEQPYWYCWNPEEKDLWVRDLPKDAITEDKYFKKGMTYVEWALAKWDRTNDVSLLGIRTQESLRRLRMFTGKSKHLDITLSESVVDVDFQDGTRRYCKKFNGYPIYDWNATDVWKLVDVENLDYNRTYDYFNKTSHYNKFSAQRVSQPFGEEPLRNMWLYSECFPELWHKMLSRVKGVNAASLYSNTELWGVQKDVKPDNLTWKEYLQVNLTNYKGIWLTKVKKNVNKAIMTHYNVTDDAIPEEKPHIVSGCSYKFLCKLVIKGDFKGRTIARMSLLGEKRREKENISRTNAEINHGKNQTASR